MLSKFHKNKVLFYTLLFSITPLVVVSILFYMKPYFGLMDDGSNLSYARSLHGIGDWISFIFSKFFEDTRQNGRFRFFYFVMIGLLYGPNAYHPIGLQLTSLALSIVILTTAATALVRASRLLYTEKPLIQPVTMALAAILGAWIFPFTIYWFNAPSVHEKLVVLGASCFLLYLIHFAKLGFRFWLPLSLLVLLTCSNTKEQIVIYYPAFVALQWGIDRKIFEKNYRRTISIILIGVFVIGIIYWIGINATGTYKQKYALSEIVTTLRNSKSIPLFIGAFLFSSFLANRNRRRTQNLELMAFEVLLSFSFIVFCLLMAPWGVGHYLNSACVFPAMLLGVQIFRELTSKESRLELHILTAMTLAGAGIAGSMYTRKLHVLSDLSRLVSQTEIRNRIPSGSKVYISGIEAPATIEQYLRWESHSIKRTPINDADYVFLVGSWNDPDHVAGFNRLIYQSQFSDGINVWARD